MMQKLSREQKIFYALRFACAMCFIGHGAFGIITKAIWCSYFGVFGIGEKMAYQLMPVIGSIDILCGLLLLFIPFRGVFVWLVIWGMCTALLRPLSGDPLAEFFERAGNYGAPFMLLFLIGGIKNPGQKILSRVTKSTSFGEKDHQKLITGLQVICFLLFAGHGWLNLVAKKGLVLQYASLGFSDPHFISQLIGLAELTAAFLLLLRPSPKLVFALFLWKMGSELFYPSHEIFEWIERGGSYGALLALWFAVKQKPFLHENRQLSFLSLTKTLPA